MSQPSPYTRTAEFYDDERTNRGGRSTVSTADLDAEFDAISTSITGVRASLTLNQRDDGEIRDGRVKLFSLSADVLALLTTGNITEANLHGPWVTATGYVKLDIVTQSNNTYIAALAHTSGTFATDLAASRWLLFAQGATAAAAIGFTPTSTLAATNVQAAIDEADTENRALSAAASALATSLDATIRADLADTTSADNGDELLGVRRDDLAGSVATNQHEINKGAVIDVARHFGLTLGAASGAQRIANAAELNAALVSAKIINSSIKLPAGRVEYDGTLFAQNGVNVEGFGNFGEDTGSVYHGTTLVYYGTGLAVSMVGASAVTNRIQCRWSDLVLKDSAAGAATRGIDLGWNQRSQDLLRNVTIIGFGDHGLKFVDQNWIVSFTNVRVESCGTRTAGSSGIGKLASVDSGTLNTITFNGLIVEANGTGTSVGGGVNLPNTGTGNRGFYFNNCCIEGNFGVAEVYASNISDLQFNNLYTERATASTQITGVDLLSCTAGFTGGFIAAESKTHDMSGASGQKVLTFAGAAPIIDGAVGQLVIGVGIVTGSRIASVQAGVGFTLDINTTAILATTSVRYGFPQHCISSTSSDVTLTGTSITGWLGAPVQSVGSVVRTRGVALGIPNPPVYVGDASAQWFGEYVPSFSANRNGTNQTGIVTATFTKVQFNNEARDMTGSFDAVTNYRWTPINIGVGHVDVSVTFTAAVDQTRIIISLYKNGVAYKSANFQCSGAGSQTAQLSVDIETLATTDYFEVWVRQDSGSNKDISGTTDETYFTGQMRG